MLAVTNITIADEDRFKELDTERTVAIQAAIDSQDLRPSTEAVARYLGGADYKLTPKMRRRVEKGIESVVGMVTPRAAYRVVTADQFRTGFDTFWSTEDPHRPSPDAGIGKIPAAYVAIYLATLGGALETACRSMADRNKLFQSMMMDAVGTAMLDIMGARLEALVDGEARRLGLYAGCRVGPGLNGMALESQALLFRLLDSTAMGVQLNEAFVMEPTKTISAFILFNVDKKKPGRGHKCSQCKLKDCQFRTMSYRKKKRRPFMAKQMLIDATRGKTTEKAPWVPYAGVHCAYLIGEQADKYFKDPELIAKGVVTAAKKYRADGIPLMFDLSVEAESIGCEVEYWEDNVPSVRTHPCDKKTPEELELGAMSKTSGRWPTIFEAAALAKPQLDEMDCAMLGLVTGPLTLASHLAGVRIFTAVKKKKDGKE